MREGGIKRGDYSLGEGSEERGDSRDWERGVKREWGVG